jgi:hypothetical protein
LAQAVHILESENCQIFKSKEGCCALWWAQLQSNSKTTRDISATKTVPQFDEAAGQARFWSFHGADLLAIDGLCFLDTRRSFNEIEKIDAWIRQNGRCFYCHKLLFLGQAIGHHDEPWANGGKTEKENCIVFHKVCHEKFHHNKRLMS